MRILIAHNHYQQAGGEDAVVAEEYALLTRHRMTVELYEKHNRDIPGMAPLQVAMDTLWSKRTAQEMAARIKDFAPDIIHVHNTFPLISPSIYYAAARYNIPVVQSLHNFRLFCVQAMFMRNGQVCEDCLGKLPWRGALRGCYRESKAQSATVAGLLGWHRMLGTYQHKITRYIALNRFCRDKFVEAGLPPERMAVKPNFIDLPQHDGTSASTSRSGALFVGRLSAEKGTDTLARAAARCPELHLDVIGSGPQTALLVGKPNICLHGWQTPAEIYAHMRRASYLVMPSIWYENFPRTLVEAFACGLPVIASRLGAMAELVHDGETGLLFDPGNADDLTRKLKWAESHADEMLRMGRNARQEYEQNYTSEINFSQLMAIYHEAIHAHQGNHHAE